jgi:hypothetical protein
LWTPGYWGYAVGGYFWVPGTWVAPPQVGLLWTPGYWGFVGGLYGWHGGYWGPHVGFYGGVNYGFGYGGHGFFGGRWNGAHFAYNTSITNVNTTIIHNTYRENITVNNVSVNRTSFNGGPKGIVARPTVEENLALKDVHVKPGPQQLGHFAQASKNPALYAKTNAGHPRIAATSQPGAFHSPGVVPARGTTATAALVGKQATQGEPRPIGREPSSSASAGAGNKAMPPHGSTVAHATTPMPPHVMQPPPHMSSSPARVAAVAHQTSPPPPHVTQPPPRVSPPPARVAAVAHQTSTPSPHVSQPSHPAAPGRPAQSGKKEPGHK